MGGIFNISRKSSHTKQSIISIPMNKLLSLTIFSAVSCTFAFSQVRPNASGPAGNQTVAQREATSFDPAEYGVSFQIEPRLIVMMAALEAAGFDPTPAGTEPTVFRAQVRKDLADLDPDLRTRLRSFYERNKLPAPATPADQAARYVSLAFALGPPLTLEAPARSEDLPTSLLEVLDFAPLVQEFYRRSNIDERIATYTRAYQAEADRLRKPTAEVVRDVLSYLHTRPITVSLERVMTKAPTTGKKKNAPQTYTTREQLRRFFVVPDLLGAAGTINFRVIGDDYYAVLPEGTDPAASELRRGYFQYVIDPLLVRFNREIAARREPIKQLLAEREKAGAAVSPDIFLTVSRSLVSAADARFEEVGKLGKLQRDTRARLVAAKDDAARQVITKEFQSMTTAIQDESVARLAEQYERGAVLSFFFADQLKGIESSGFDVANFFGDMISSFDPARESRRLTENAEARQRALAARQARLSARRVEDHPVYTPAEAARASALVKSLADIEQVLRQKDYVNAESRLKELMKDYSREPRIFFALAQTASLAAADATDEDVQAERLNRALANYRLALEASSPDTDRAIISRAHEAMGRIYSFLEKPAEASSEFEKAIQVGDVPGGAYKEALEGKRKLAAP
jgi:hypothetical protein